jgi:hypothetical protein
MDFFAGVSAAGISAIKKPKCPVISKKTGKNFPENSTLTIA